MISYVMVSFFFMSHVKTLFGMLSYVMALYVMTSYVMMSYVIEIHLEEVNQAIISLFIETKILPLKIVLQTDTQTDRVRVAPQLKEGFENEDNLISKCV